MGQEVIIAWGPLPITPNRMGTHPIRYERKGSHAIEDVNIHKYGVVVKNIVQAAQ